VENTTSLTYTPSQALTNTFRILYVEGDLATELAFIRAFGATVAITPVDTIQQALDLLLEGFAFELIIVNVNLGGFKLLNLVKAHPEWNRIPVILTADNITNDLKKRTLKNKGLDVFAKQGDEKPIRIRLDYLARKKTYLQPDTEPILYSATQIPVGKRLFDIIFSGGVLLVLSPLLTVVAILIKLDSSGPVFYRSKRVGAGYRIFDMFKFRTMRQDADKQLAKMASLNIYNKKLPEDHPTPALCEACTAMGTACQHPLYLDHQQVCEKAYATTKKGKATFSKFHQDPRVTRLGKMLRDYSIDELPQFLNILRGDMSLVGNRPLPPYEAEKLTQVAYARRFAAPAGLTGLWQVTKRGQTKQLSDEERIQLDVLYARKFSFWMDMKIILKTLKAVWQKESM